MTAFLKAADLTQDQFLDLIKNLQPDTASDPGSFSCTYLLHKLDTFYEIGLDFHAISRKNVNIRKLKSKAEPKTK